MFCQHCGHQNNNDAVFCQKCGKKMNPDIPSDQSGASQAPEAVANSGKGKKKKPKSKLMKVLTFVVAGIAIVWMISDGMKGYQKADEWVAEVDPLELVQTSYLDGYPNKTTGEAVNGLFTNPVWTVLDESDGLPANKTEVIAEGQISINGDDASVSLYFSVDREKKTYKISGLSFNQELQTNGVIEHLLKEMYK